MTKLKKTNSRGVIITGTAAVALAAGGLVGCEQSAPPKLKMTGVPGLHGDHPGLGAPPLPDGSEVEFTPEYYAVVYLQFDNGARLTARHAYFPVTEGAADKVVTCALGYLRSFDTSPASKPDCEPFTDPKRPNPVSENFDDFAFGSQQRLYVFVDNTNVQFNRTTPVSFTPFGAFDDPGALGAKTRDLNYSFYNAKFGDFGQYKQVMIIDNYYRGVDGKPISDIDPYANSASYSISFNLVTCRNAALQCDPAEPKQVIPIVIDPDTANGKGNKP